jgi:CubicO group peptidase (beta-lactamase class C family)
VTEEPTPRADRSRRKILGLLAATPVAAGVVLAAPRTAHAGASGAEPAFPPVPKELRPSGAFDRFIAEQAAQGRFTGTVLLAQRGRPVLSRSHGMANMRPAIPNGPDTLFGLASVTKMMTGIAAVQLAQQGKLALFDKLGAYLDGFPAKAADNITVHQLIVHRSGFGNYKETKAYQEESRKWASASEVMNGITSIIKQEPLAFDPDTASKYSNSGYHILGEVIARASGMPYHDYMREHIFRASGMRISDFYNRDQWRDDPRIAHPFSIEPNGDRVDIVDQQIFIGTPAGNAFASAPDLVSFGRAMAGERLLNRAYSRLALGGKSAGRWTDSPEVPPMHTFGGYGPTNAIVNNHRILFHNGGFTGQSTFLEIYPDLDLVTVVLGNSDGPATSPIVNFARRYITARPPKH